MANRYTRKTIYKINWDDLSNFGYYDSYEPCVYTLCQLHPGVLLTTDTQHMLKRIRTGKTNNNIRQRLSNYLRTDPNSRHYRTHNEEIVRDATHVEVLKMPNMPRSTMQEQRRLSMAMEELEDTLIKVSWPCYNIRQKEAVIHG